MSGLAKCHWRHKIRDLQNHVDGCLKCHQYKDLNHKRATQQTSVDMPERQWGSLAGDFIVDLPKCTDVFDAITNFLDSLTRIVHFLNSCTTDTAFETND